MPKYRVRAGESLAHDNTLLPAGTVVVLLRRVAEDPANRHLLEEIDESGKPVTPLAADIARELERYYVHEQISLLEPQVAAAKQRFDELAALLQQKKAELAAQAKTVTATVTKIHQDRDAADAAAKKE